ncbi:MAG: PadR family transcriptional regulator [Candidatus Heimdallarchaeota archaeon]|nr:MAG: PadR family transcriptional regulator [Candidatus Heimdallarchaeota archaeon]
MRTDKRKDTIEPRKKSTIVKHWERDLRRGLLQLMILILIRLQSLPSSGNEKEKESHAHGYGLIKVIRDSGIPLKAGTIYPLLKRMEDDGLISSIPATGIDSAIVARKIYTITDIGEEMIEEMMDTYSPYHESIKKWYQVIKNQRG